MQAHLTTLRMMRMNLVTKLIGEEWMMKRMKSTTMMRTTKMNKRRALIKEAATVSQAMMLTEGLRCKNSMKKQVIWGTS